MMDTRRILIVDDDEAILKSFASILGSEGYSVETAKTGREGIERSKARDFAVALLDIKLPDMEGTELLAEMHKGRPRTMKIMVTGHATLSNAVESLNLGADAYIMKPVDPAHLLEIIGKQLHKKEEAESMDQEKVSEWIEGRIRRLEQGEIV